MSHNKDLLTYLMFSYRSTGNLLLSLADLRWKNFDNRSALIGSDCVFDVCCFIVLTLPSAYNKDGDWTKLGQEYSSSTFPMTKHIAYSLIHRQPAIDCAREDSSNLLKTEL